jgi:hypothetical protein
MRTVTAIFVAVMLFASVVSAQQPAKITEYYGMCDASAAVSIGQDMFMVANDEDNILRVYRRDQGGPPVKPFDLISWLKAVPKKKESDIEGATRIKDRVYWIASHGNKKDGTPDPNRLRFFATDLKGSGDSIEIELRGEPYRNLQTDLCDAPALKDLKLKEASAPGTAPEHKGGFNIEGLCATPQGTLLIGFRNPIPEGKALIVPLENPDEVLQGNKPKFGGPIFVPLGGLGIRSIEYSEALAMYLIIAGPYNDVGGFRLYKWSGKADDSPVIAKDVDFQDLHPEALVVYPGEKTIQILSDDGDRQIEGEKCKDVTPEKRRFRSIQVNLAQP